MAFHRVLSRGEGPGGDTPSWKRRFGTASPAYWSYQDHPVVIHPAITTISSTAENIPAGTGGPTTNIRVIHCFSTEDTAAPGVSPAVLEVGVNQGDILAADEILSFASIHGDFACIPDRIFHRFEVILPPESRLEILKDALLQIVHLEDGGARSEGLTPYQVEDLIDALERTRQTLVNGGDAAGDDTPAGAP